MIDIITLGGGIMTIIILGSITGAILIWHFYKMFKFMWEDTELFRTLRMIEKLDEEVEEERQGTLDLLRQK